MNQLDHVVSVTHATDLPAMGSVFLERHDIRHDLTGMQSSVRPLITGMVAFSAISVRFCGDDVRS